MPGAGAERDDDLARDRRSAQRPERHAGRLREGRREPATGRPSAERPASERPGRREARRDEVRRDEGRRDEARRDEGPRDEARPDEDRRAPARRPAREPATPDSASASVPDRAADGAGEHDTAARGRVRTAREAVARAAHHVQDLTGGEPEGVTSLERTGDGWRVDIEVVESRRIPDSTDILAVYRVEVDEEGELVSYRRAGRYYRGRAQEGEP